MDRIWLIRGFVVRGGVVVPERVERRLIVLPSANFGLGSLSREPPILAKLSV